VVTQIKDVVLPSIDYKPVEIPKVNTNINALSIALAFEDIVHMVDQVVNASLAKDYKKIDGDVDSQLESSIDNKIRFAMLRVNEEFAKKQLEFAEPNATPTKIGTSCNSYTLRKARASGAVTSAIPN
jgi:hypothetical protein